jgi:hypothetical protein
MKKKELEEMRKKDAAKYVGCSVRSLENYTSQGRVTVKYEKSKTRPVAIYTRADLDRLKADLNSTLYAPAVSTREEGMRGEGESIVRRESATDLVLVLTRIFEAMQELAGKEREPSIVELAHMPLLKLKEAERYSNLSRAELLEAIATNDLKATQTAEGEWKIRREVLEEYIRKNF